MRLGRRLPTLRAAHRNHRPSLHLETAAAQDASEADHLSSDTYKRLNLALLWWSAGTAAALWLAPQQPIRLALG